MRYFLAVIFAIDLVSGFCFAGEQLELKDPKDKESYSLGYQFGQNLKAQGLDINLQVYTSGIQDALGRTKPQLSQEDISRIISEIQQRDLAAREKGFKVMAEKNLAQSKAFMEENKKKEGVKTLSSGLQYKVLNEGSGKSPKISDTVTVNYRGALIDGTEFDNSYTRGTLLTFQIDKVISGWKEALQSMKENSKWELFVPPELGYGEQGVGPIPPNSALIFEVELLAIK